MPPKNSNAGGNNRTPRRMLPAVPQQPARNKRARPRKPRRRRNGARRPGATLSKAGINFLKCAFAAPDFAVDPGQGIPDNYEGKAVMRKDVSNNTISFTVDVDTFILVMPTPGVAYWSCTVPIGEFPTQSTVWTPTYNASFTTLFGTSTNQAEDAPVDPVERGKNATNFRYASNVCEITPTSNYTQFAGSITVWKVPITMADFVQTTGTGEAQLSTVQKSLVGVEGLTRVSPDNKPFKFLDGAFSMAVNTQPDWQFSPILSGVTRIPSVGQSAVNNPTWGQFQGDFIGLGTLESLVFRVSTPAGAVNSAIIKVWSCVEYQPTPGSVFYEFAGTTPSLDPLALKLYRDIALKIPVAVTVMENDGFWSDKVMPALKASMNALRIVGGVVPQVGAAMAGIDALTGLFGML
uniref:Capsid protein alpha n=1 Tax=Culannivirus DW-2019a TaxID=2501413 RepID=A0A3Q9R346_9VIRU|nr:putative capsid protein precursor alpha [Culannivirus DW-2019a]